MIVVWGGGEVDLGVGCQLGMSFCCLLVSEAFAGSAQWKIPLLEAEFLSVINRISETDSVLTHGVQPSRALANARGVLQHIVHFGICVVQHHLAHDLLKMAVGARPMSQAPHVCTVGMGEAEEPTPETLPGFRQGHTLAHLWDELLQQWLSCPPPF